MERIRRDLAYLAGPEAAGRLSGTRGARLAAKYLAGALRTIGLAPAGTDGYDQPVTVPAARLAAPVHLRIGGRPYEHRTDYGEVAPLSAGVTGLSAPLVVVGDGDLLDPGQLKDTVVLIPERPEGFDLNATAEAAADLGVKALLVEHGEPRWFHKTVFGSTARRIPVIRLRQATATQLAGQTGALVDLSLPLEVSALPCQNVLGLLAGTNPGAPAVLLTAHYDHVGDDPGGHRFPGAGDNASGVAAILAAARTLAAQALPFPVLVAFLTGEESGLWGARHLAAHLPLPVRAVINVDGVGVEPTLAAVRLGHTAPGAPLAGLAADLFRQRSTQVQWIAGSDDSAAFLQAGLPTVGIGQQPTGPLPFHTPDDTVVAVFPEVVAQGAEAVAQLVTRLALSPAGPA